MRFRRDKLSPNGGVMMRTEAQKRAQANYEAKGVYYVVKLNLNRSGHADIIRKLESVPNMQGYLKDLIRRDLKGGTNDGSAEEGASEVR